MNLNNKPYLTLITPTGGRPEAFALCEKWMAQQTIFQTGHILSGVEWLVVDDCDPLTKTTHLQTVLRPAPLWSEGQNTQARNLIEALTVASGDYIAFIEDDDYYAPKYLQVMIRAAINGQAALVGGNCAVYYHLPTKRFKYLDNLHHASLCSTIMRRDLIPLFLDILNNPAGKFFDIELWHSRQLDNDKTARRLLCPSSSLCVGVKGLPGRPGIGMGHTPPHEWRVDSQLQIAEQLFKNDLSSYLPYLCH